jgi:hypothetical protein
MSQVRRNTLTKAIQSQSIASMARMEEISKLIKAGEDLTKKQLQEIRDNLAKIAKDLNDPEMKAKIKEMEIEDIRKAIKIRSIVPKSQ